MKTTVTDWLKWSKDEVLPFEGSTSLHVRSQKECAVYTDEGLLIGLGKGEQFIYVSGVGEISFECESEIWLKPSARVQERLPSSNEVFTTLDRPAPLSPEMLAIERMMRKNEIARERDREQLERALDVRLRNELRRQSEQAVGSVSTETTQSLGTDTGASGNDAENQEDAAGEDVVPDRVPEASDGRNEGSAESL